MKDLFYLTRQILRFSLERQADGGEESALVHSFMTYGSLYVVADPQTSAAEWESKTFGIATSDSSLRLFLDKEDAIFYAKKIGAMLRDGRPMIMKTTQAMVNSLIENYSRKGFITGVWLCGKTPIKAKVGIVHFAGRVKKDKASTITDPDGQIKEEPALGTVPDSVPEPEIEAQPADVESSSEPLKLVDEARRVLSEPSKSVRRKLDPTESFMNLHWLIEKLLFANRIDPADMDERLGLVKGFTKNFISDKTKDTIPMDVVGKYLRYFGLYEFLFLFRQDCKELRDMLNGNPKLDKYEVVQAKGPRVGEEVFELSKVERTQTNDGVNVYRLTFKSPERESPVQIISSTNINMNIGNKYVLGGLQPVHPLTTTVSVKGAATAGAEKGPSENELAEALAKAEEKEQSRTKNGKRDGSKTLQGRSDHAPVGKLKYQDMTPEERLEADRQTVLEWIIKHKQIGAKEARAEMSKFEDDPDVIASFAKFATAGGKAASGFGRRGYTPARLMHDLSFTPIEAFTILADIRRKPTETLQMLKYRETDPQYQKSKPTPKQK